jgi:hypothetical protein
VHISLLHLQNTEQSLIEDLVNSYFLFLLAFPAGVLYLSAELSLLSLSVMDLFLYLPASSHSTSYQDDLKATHHLKPSSKESQNCPPSRAGQDYRQAITKCFRKFFFAIFARGVMAGSLTVIGPVSSNCVRMNHTQSL